MNDDAGTWGPRHWRPRARPLGDEAAALARRARLPARATTRASQPKEPARATTAQRLGLTARELVVLGLLSEGLSNSAIGKQLFMSPKTASVHVTHILTKLGATNRTQAAAVAHRLGLDGPSA
jgi:DNA-binding NarL/FixJ family response regulator